MADPAFEERDTLSGVFVPDEETHGLKLYPLVAVIITVLLGAATLWVLQHGYVNDMALDRWSKVLQVFDAKLFRIEHFSFLYPHFPVYVASLFYPFPGLRGGAAPYAAAVLFAGILIFYWLHTMIHRGVSLGRSLILLLLVLINPITLWAITSGSNLTMIMLVFFMIFLAFIKIVEAHFLRAYLVLSVALGLYFFIDGLAFFLFITLLPLMAMAAPDRIYEDSPISFYLVLGFPFVLLTLSWAYLNWLFHGDPWAFLRLPESGYIGGRMMIADFPWLRQYGGEILRPIGVMTVAALISHPVILFFLRENRGNGRRLWASMIMFMYPVIAAGFATSNYYLGNPLEILVLTSASVLAEITIMAEITRRHFLLLCLMLLLNIPGSWLVFQQLGNDDAHAWEHAVIGHSAPQSERMFGDLTLGRFLAHSDVPTMIDELSARRVIVAKENGENLIISFTDRFKIAMRHSIPDVRQLAVPDPATFRGRKDLLNQHFFNLYAHGMPGFRLVYDQEGWRVYRRVDL